jgi:hypothetical protein
MVHNKALCFAIALAAMVAVGLTGYFIGEKVGESNTAQTGGKASDKTAPKTKVSPSGTVAFTMLAGDFADEFSKNQLSASKKFAGKRLRIGCIVGYIDRQKSGEYGILIGYDGFPRIVNERWVDEISHRIQCLFANESDVLQLESGNRCIIDGTFREFKDSVITLAACKVVAFGKDVDLEAWSKSLKTKKP